MPTVKKPPPKRHRRPVRRRDQTQKLWAQYENVGLKPTLDLDDIVLNWTDKKIKDLDAKGGLVSCQLERTIEGGSTLTIVVRDPTNKIFSRREGRTTVPKPRGKRPVPPRVDAQWAPILAPNSRGLDMRVELDGVTFSLVKVGHTWSTGETTLTFEDLIVFLLKRRGKRPGSAKRVKRSQSTRAEFISALLAEADLKSYGYRFICPDLHVAQAIDGSKSKGGTAGGATPPDGKRILWVGDSLTVGTVPQARKLIAAIDSQGKVGRNSRDTLTMLRKKMNSKHGTVVFDAGTNDDPGNPSAYQAILEDVVQAVGARKLVLATLNSHYNTAAMNTVVHSVASAHDATVVEWKQAVSDHPSLVGPDHTHPGPGGYLSRAKLFQAAIGAAKPSASKKSHPQRSRRTVQPRQAASSGGGFARGATIKCGGGAASSTKRRDLALILAEAARLGASKRVMIACVMCTTQESTCQPLTHGDNVRNDTIGYFQQGPEWIAPHNALNPTLACRTFLLGHDAHTGGRGAVRGWKQHYGNLKDVPGGYEHAITTVQVGGAGVHQWQSEAEHTVNAWNGQIPSGGSGVADGQPGTSGGSVTVTKAYMFTRNEDENSWEAIQRLSQEVNWPFFVNGKSVYYETEDRLYGQAPLYVVSPGSDGIIELTTDVDWGKPVSTASLTATLDRWSAGPGKVVVLEGFGPPDGRWLVSNVSRDWFSPVAEITLIQPGKAKLEPKPETSTKTVAGTSPGAAPGGSGDDASVAGGNAVERLFQACKKISDATGNYVYGGNHGPALSAMRPSQHFDCSSSTSYALYLAGLWPKNMPSTAQVSGAFGNYGRNGHGTYVTISYDSTHVFIYFEKPIHGFHRFDTSMRSGDGDMRSGPRLRRGSRELKSGLAHYPGM